MSNPEQPYTMNQCVKGHVRMWEFSKERGYGRLIYEASNLITYEGASVAARAIAGQPNSGVSHMYIGYYLAGDTQTLITPALGNNVSSFGSQKLILPLSFAPTFGSTGTDYEANIVYFTTYLTGFDAARETSLVSGDTINSLGLVNRTNSYDYLFSRIAIDPIVEYTHSVAITWGLTFITTDPTPA